MANRVVIYTKDWCGYCSAAKKLLETCNLDYEEIDVTNDSVRFQEMLQRSEGRRTVPQIFIDGKGIGGFTDLYQLVNRGDPLLEG